MSLCLGHGESAGLVSPPLCSHGNYSFRTKLKKEDAYWELVHGNSYLTTQHPRTKPSTLGQQPRAAAGRPRPVGPRQKPATAGIREEGAPLPSREDASLHLHPGGPRILFWANISPNICFLVQG